MAKATKKAAGKAARAGKRRDDIVAILLVTVGLLLAIAVLSQRAGIMGRYGDLGLRYLVGTGRFGLPFILVALGAIVALKGSVARIPIAGLAAVFLSLVGILQLGVPLQDFFTVEQTSSHGGYAGAVIGWPLLKLVGLTGAYIVCVAALLIGIVLATGFSFSERMQNWWERRRQEKDHRQAHKKASAARAERSARAARGAERTAGPSAQPGPDPLLPAEPVFELSTVVVDPAAVFDSPEYRSAEAADALAKGSRRREPNRIPGSPAGTASGGSYQIPPLNIFDLSPPPTEVSKKELNEGIAVLEQTLKDFDVEAKVNKVIKGPTVTRFELTLASGIKVQKVSNLSDNIAMALAARDIRILAPIPGKSAIGIEVPNRKKDLVCLGDILRSPAASEMTSPVAFAVGKDISGKPVIADLTQMPHLLIAGATGSGKSVMINSTITSILSRALPSAVRMILIDPKLVELTQYNNLPHLLTPVISHPKRAANALAWAVGQMEERYQSLFEAGVRNIASYNEWLKKEDPTAPPMPYIVIVIDELADLMIVAAKEVEDAICRLTQMARACGIHLVVATQRPSVDVITGLIKANIPSRVAFAVASMADSRVILDQGGAEKLVGRGDMLFMTPSSLRPERIQGSFVSDREVEAVAKFIKGQASPQYLPDVIQDPRGEVGDTDMSDPLFEQAVEVVLQTGQASVSYLQRRLGIGYTRAGRLMDILEARGIVGGYEGSKPREVLITRDEWSAK